MTGPSERPSGKPLLDTLHGHRGDVPPIWLMRQAGRYLPEYRALRKEAGSFLDLCMTPDMAAEVTLQPIRRFGLDGAILFSDILVIPHALGQKLWFEEGLGPRLDPLRSPEDIGRRLDPSRLHESLAPVYETLRRVASALPASTTLLGFAGAPWTVASYMVEGGSSRDFAAIKRWAYGDPESFATLIDLITEATGDYLIAQIEAGAEAVQIFDSWAGSLPAPEVLRWSLAPGKRLIAKVKNAHPQIPVIFFPRGVGPLYEDFAVESGADALSLDTGLAADWARARLQPRVCVQGNLDPQHLVVGGDAMREAARRIVGAFASGPHVFNLGHGVVPDTPPEHVGELVALLREGGGNAGAAA